MTIFTKVYDKRLKATYYKYTERNWRLTSEPCIGGDLLNMGQGSDLGV